MTPETMRAIDWYAGVPLCYLLVIVKRLGALFARRKERAVRSVLLMKFFGMGSIALTAPSVAAVRAQFPQARIHYLTFAQNREIIELLRLADEVHCIDTRSFISFVRSTLVCL